MENWNAAKRVLDRLPGILYALALVACGNPWAPRPDCFGGEASVVVEKAITPLKVDWPDSKLNLHAVNGFLWCSVGEVGTRRVDLITGDVGNHLWIASLSLMKWPAPRIRVDEGRRCFV